MGPLGTVRVRWRGDGTVVGVVDDSRRLREEYRRSLLTTRVRSLVVSFGGTETDLCTTDFLVASVEEEISSWSPRLPRLEYRLLPFFVDVLNLGPFGTVSERTLGELIFGTLDGLLTQRFDFLFFSAELCVSFVKREIAISESIPHFIGDRFVSIPTFIGDRFVFGTGDNSPSFLLRNVRTTVSGFLSTATFFLPSLDLGGATP